MRPHENRLLIPLLIILMFIAFSLPLAAGQWEEPSQILLTWQNDPTKTMTITWRADVKNADSLVYYSQDEDPVKEGKRKEAKTFSFEETEALLHTAELTGLEPNTKYRTIVETAGEGSKEFLFRTAPEQSQKISFVVGGDSQTQDYRREINRKAASEAPDFVLFGGDLIQKPLSESQWNAWFDDWHEFMITEDGRRIPIIPAVGCHNVSGKYSQQKDNAAFYYNRFPLAGNEKYYSLSYGPDLKILTLDSGHTSEVTGPQLDWLEKTLKRYEEENWIVAQYHVPAWPNHRDLDLHTSTSGISKRIRENWVPLLEKHDTELVSENHAHTYKRTAPLHHTYRIYEWLESSIKQEMARAEEQFNPKDDYSPWSNEELQKLSRGDYEEAGYESYLSALKELCFYYSLYAKQQSNFNYENIYNLVTSSRLHENYYWGWMTSSGYFEDLVDEEGITYIGDGGWGAPLGDPRNPENYWWLDDSGKRFHYWRADFLPKEERLQVQPVFYLPRKDKWERGAVIDL